MLSRKALKITGAAIAVTAIAIGLGIGLAPKKNDSTKQLTASQASGWNLYCGRRLDGTGRYLSAPTNRVRGEERKLGKEFIVSAHDLNILIIFGIELT
jgi:ABC-type antimicrobial peptide transport system permease subunit